MPSHYANEQFFITAQDTNMLIFIAALGILLVPTLIVAVLVALRTYFLRTRILTFTNLLFYIFLPCYIGVWVAFSSCSMIEGACSVMLMIPPILLKPAAMISILLGLLVPSPALVFGPPLGLAIASLFRMKYPR